MAEWSPSQEDDFVTAALKLQAVKYDTVQLQDAAGEGLSGLTNVPPLPRTNVRIYFNEKYSLEPIYETRIEFNEEITHN